MVRTKPNFSTPIKNEQKLSRLTDPIKSHEEAMIQQNIRPLPKPVSIRPKDKLPKVKESPNVLNKKVTTPATKPKLIKFKAVINKDKHPENKPKKVTKQTSENQPPEAIKTTVKEVASKPVKDKISVVSRRMPDPEKSIIKHQELRAQKPQKPSSEQAKPEHKPARKAGPLHVKQQPKASILEPIKPAPQPYLKSRPEAPVVADNKSETHSEYNYIAPSVPTINQSKEGDTPKIELTINTPPELVQNTYESTDPIASFKAQTNPVQEVAGESHYCHSSEPEGLEDKEAELTESFEQLIISVERESAREDYLQTQVVEIIDEASRIVRDSLVDSQLLVAEEVEEVITKTLNKLLSENNLQYDPDSLRVFAALLAEKLYGELLLNNQQDQITEYVDDGMHEVLQDFGTSFAPLVYESHQKLGAVVIGSLHKVAAVPA